MFKGEVFPIFGGSWFPAGMMMMDGASVETVFMY